MDPLCLSDADLVYLVDLIDLDIPCVDNFNLELPDLELSEPKLLGLSTTSTTPSSIAPLTPYEKRKLRRRSWRYKATDKAYRERIKAGIWGLRKKWKALEGVLRDILWELHKQRQHGDITIKKLMQASDHAIKTAESLYRQKTWLMQLDSLKRWDQRKCSWRRARL